jgi:phosphohistidine phosphatase
MLTLLLLRHAKSSWSDAALDDRDRPLNARGRRASSAMGRVLASVDPAPERVLCSPARRARETWELAQAALTPTPPLEIAPALYDFGDGAALMDFLKDWPGPERVLLLVGHNPSLEGLVKLLAARGDHALLAKLTAKYPTGALAVIGLEPQSWAALHAGAGTLLRFIRPRDIMAGADG